MSSNAPNAMIARVEQPSGPELNFGSSLMGSLATGFCGKFAEILRKFLGNTFYCSRKFCGNLQKIGGNFRKFSCNDPFPNDPISELLRILPEAQVARNYVTNIIQIPCKNYGAQE